ncbi:MAG: hypothetical protein NC320_09745 [Clostridium sp.]|nr:hypothetical protein [Clostridium sp.]
MKKMTTSDMMQANGGKSTYYRVNCKGCGGRDIYVKSILSWNAHCKRQGHTTCRFINMFFVTTYDKQSRTDWNNKKKVYI